MTPMAGIGAWAWTNSRREGVGQRRLDVGVFGLEDEPDKPAVAVDEVVLVDEPHRVPLELGLDRQRDGEAMPLKMKERLSVVSSWYLMGVNS